MLYSFGHHGFELVDRLHVSHDGFHQDLLTFASLERIHPQYAGQLVLEPGKDVLELANTLVQVVVHVVSFIHTKINHALSVKTRTK